MKNIDYDELKIRRPTLRGKNKKKKNRNRCGSERDDGKRKNDGGGGAQTPSEGCLVVGVRVQQGCINERDSG